MSFPNHTPSTKTVNNGKLIEPGIEPGTNKSSGFPGGFANHPPMVA